MGLPRQGPPADRPAEATRAVAIASRNEVIFYYSVNKTLNSFFNHRTPAFWSAGNFDKERGESTI